MNCVCGHSKQWHGGQFPYPCRGRTTIPNGCGCKRFRQKSTQVIRSGFDDVAKKRRGVSAYDPAIEIAMLKSELQATKDAHADRLKATREWIGSAIAALEEGRRGDAMKVLRQMAITPGKMPVMPAEPQEPVVA